MPKAALHPRNYHQGQYDFDRLLAALPSIEVYLKKNPKGKTTIDFFDPMAVKALNKALLIAYYNVDDWDIPEGYLCPPIPSRADYIHHLADLLSKNYKGKIPKGKQVHCLDVGVGANCIYPILGNRVYGWSFIGADVNPASLEIAQLNINRTTALKKAIVLRRQPNLEHIFKGIWAKGERLHLTLCNPPFHSSAKEATTGTKRKLQNLRGKENKNTTLNFGGQAQELWCEGGEVAFIGRMIEESKAFAHACLWFSALVSKEQSLKPIQRYLDKVSIQEQHIIPMKHGHKNSRILAWTFLTKEQQALWIKLK